MAGVAETGTKVWYDCEPPSVDSFHEKLVPVLWWAVAVPVLMVVYITLSGNGLAAVGLGKSARVRVICALAAMQKAVKPIASNCFFISERYTDF